MADPILQPRFFRTFDTNSRYVLMGLIHLSLIGVANAEYKNTGPGSDSANRLPWVHQLTDEEAAEYTNENIFKADTTTATKLKGDWNPVVGEK